MNIVVTRHYSDEWTAYDSDSYDGAPDAGSANTIGIGNSEETAIEDLLQQMENGAPWQQEAARAYRGVKG